MTGGVSWGVVREARMDVEKIENIEGWGLGDGRWKTYPYRA
jgi:hypothetical protein